MGTNIVRGLTTEQKIERQLIENIHHEPLSDLEKAEAIKRLMEIRGWSEMLAASTLGISRIQVQRLLSLVDAPKEVKKLVEEEKLPPSVAGEIAYQLYLRTFRV